MNDIFAGTWALVTGASSGLGEEFARQLAARRANLILTARSDDKLKALATQLHEAHGISTEVIAHDLGKPDGAAELCQRVDALGHQVAHLISNAGLGDGGPFAKSELAKQTDQVRLNCEALTVLSHHFFPKLLARGAGGILHVASIAGMQPVPYMATYGATKAYVISFSLALWEEARGTGVRVHALCPGPVPTGFQKVAGLAISPSQKSAVLSAEDTVRRGLKAYEKGKAWLIPGGMNKIMSTGSNLLPRTTVTRMVGNMMKKRGRA